MQLPVDIMAGGKRVHQVPYPHVPRPMRQRKAKYLLDKRAVHNVQSMYAETTATEIVELVDKDSGALLGRSPMVPHQACCPRFSKVKLQEQQDVLNGRDRPTYTERLARRQNTDLFQGRVASFPNFRTSRRVPRVQGGGCVPFIQAPYHAQRPANNHADKQT